MRKHSAKSFEALRQAIGGKTRAVARAIMYAENTVYRWQEPRPEKDDPLDLNSGTRNPLDLLMEIHNAALKLGQTREDALAPIYWLNEQAGLIAFPAPDVKGAAPELNKSLLKTIEEFSDVAREASVSLTDGTITSEEAKKIDKEVQELIRQASAFNRAVQEAVHE